MSDNSLMSNEPVNQTCLELTAAWVESLHGCGAVSKSLAQFAEFVQASSVVLTRFSDAHGKPKILACVDLKSRKISVPVDSAPVARFILGEHMNTLEAGKVFVLSEHEELSMTADRMSLDRNMSKRGLRDVVLIAMGAHSGASDFLELHFNSDISQDDRKLLVQFASILAETWKNRRSGTAFRLMNLHRFQGLRPTECSPVVPILDISNPNGLTRSEFRVCLLIKDGMVAKEIGPALEIRQSTVRSHLRAIYSKTETTGQMALLHRMSSDSDAVASGIRIAA